MSLSKDQIEMLQRLQDKRDPTFGVPFGAAGAGGRAQRTILALEKRGLIAKAHGHWRLTAKGQVEVRALANSPDEPQHVEAARVAESAAEGDPHRGGDSYEASMLRNLLARIHGDSGHYVETHGLDKAIDDAEALVANWRAKLAAAEPAAPTIWESRTVAQPTLEQAERWCHVKTGLVYMLVGRAIREADGSPLLLYRSRDDGPSAIPWARPEAEFMDGRFVPLPPSSAGG